MQGEVFPSKRMNSIRTMFSQPRLLMIMQKPIMTIRYPTVVSRHLFLALWKSATQTYLTRLPTGSMVKLYVTSEQAEQVMTVPVDSVYYDGGLSYVYIYDPEESVLHKQEVEVGLYDSDWIEIKSGLSMSDQVLTTWTSELYEGTKVRLKGGQ